MGFDKVKIRQICLVSLYIAALILLIIYSEILFAGIKIFLGILLPFIIGGVIAFILNVPMGGIEEKILGKWRGKFADKAKRPVSMVLAIVLVFVIVALVIVAVVPQLRITFETLGTKVGPFADKVLIWLQTLLVDYPELEAQIGELSKIEFNWEAIIGSVGGFLKNGVGNVLGSTITIAGNIIGGVVNVLIAFVFAIYILAQKEKLQDQGSRILDAYISPKWNPGIREVFRRLHSNFTNFICGQCMEAVILGCLFIIFMTIFRLPYAVMIGTLIGFTSLIPIVGAFIGCGVGAFMILIDNPMQALWFVILFLIIQQLEGNLIYPKVVGNSVGLPSIWVLMSVTVGGSLFGVVGMLIFIPLMSTLYSLLRDDVNRRNGFPFGKKGERSRNNPHNREQKNNINSAKKQEKEKKDTKVAKAEKTAKGNKGEKAQQGEDNSAEQIVARLVAEQEVKVKSELEQEQKSQTSQKQGYKPNNPKQQKAANVPQEVNGKTENQVQEVVAEEGKKPNRKRKYYRNRNRNHQKKIVNTQQN